MNTKASVLGLPKWAQRHIELLERRVRELSADIDQLSAPAIEARPGIEYPTGAFIERVGGTNGRRPLGDEIVGVAQLSGIRGLRPDHTFYVALRLPMKGEAGMKGDEVLVRSDISLTLDFESSNCFVLRPKC